VVAILNRMRDLGVSERTVRLERDTWILMQALDPRVMPQWIQDRNARFDDPARTRQYLLCDQSVDWDPHDPRVDQLIDELDAMRIEQEDDSGRSGDLTLVSVRVAEASPAWRRVLDVLTDRARRRRIAVPNS